MFGKKEGPDDLVWIDDGIGEIIAAFGTENSSTTWIRKPRQVKRSELDVSMKILDSFKLNMYNTCIKDVEERKQRKAKKGSDAI
jgi:hypothetical protein